MGFQDECGLSEKPSVHRTWALKGKTPHIKSSGSWKKLTLSGVIITDAKGKSSKLFLRSIAGSMNAKQVLKFLKDLKRHMGGKKLLLIWDGLPAHRAKSVTKWIKDNQSWLRTIRLPSYAPELNPIEYLWGAMKKKYLGNLHDLSDIGTELKKTKRKVNDDVLLRGFLKASGLYS